MVKISVHMLAFSEKKSYPVRQVDIPDDHLTLITKDGKLDYSLSTTIPTVLELVFHYGQNDFQKQETYSVSVGDVVQLSNGTYWMVQGTGWKQLTKAEFNTIPVPSSMYAHKLEYA